MNERKTSQLTEELDCRIRTNEVFGDADMNSWLLNKLALKQGEQLLDIGCGTGKHLITFAKQTQTDDSCVGLELSAGSIKTAEESAQNQGLKIKFIEADMDQIDPYMEPEKYDIITSIYAAYYSKEIQKLLQNLNKMLKSRGKIAIMGPYGDNNRKWFDFINQFMELPDNVKKSTTTFMYDEIVPFACENFDLVECYRFVNNITIPTIDDLRNYWKSNIYYDEKYDEDFEKFAKSHFAENSTFHFSKNALLVVMNGK